MKRLLIVAAIALIAAPALAGPDILPVKGVNTGVYDLGTGKLSPAPAERMGNAIWSCTADTGWYYGAYANLWTVLDWGDLADDGIGNPGTEIGGLRFAYATDLMMPTLLDAIIVFYGDDDGFNTNTRVFSAGFWIANLPTGTATGNGWLITVDLESQAGEFDLLGNDIDGDLLMDFSYTYWFINLPASATGPFIAYDPNTTPALAPGCYDAFDVFNDPNLGPLSYVATYWFGGDPFAQFYMELYDMLNQPPQGCLQPGDAGKYCEADIVPNNGDGVWNYADDGDCQILLGDLAQLLGSYGMTSGATREDGDVDPPHPNGGDGDVDLGDLAELLGQYGDNCN
jgi:hypothetical protein